MKRIMCFGDSNTYGIDPESGARLVEEERWPCILQERLGNDFSVKEEGIGGRTTVWDDPLAPNRNGLRALPMLLDSHSPLDLVIVMLGINDLKERFQVLPEDVAAGLEKIINEIQCHSYGIYGTRPEVLVIAPPALGADVEDSRYSGFTERAVGISKKLPELYEKFDNMLADRFYIDFKLWKGTYDPTYENELKKIRSKLRKTDPRKVLYVNIIKPYGKKVKPYQESSCDPILSIPYLFDPQNYTWNIEGLKKLYQVILEMQIK